MLSHEATETHWQSSKTRYFAWWPILDPHRVSLMFQLRRYRWEFSALTCQRLRWQPTSVKRAVSCVVLHKTVMLCFEINWWWCPKLKQMILSGSNLEENNIYTRKKQCLELLTWKIWPRGNWVFVRVLNRTIRINWPVMHQHSEFITQNLWFIDW